MVSCQNQRVAIGYGPVLAPFRHVTSSYGNTVTCRNGARTDMGLGCQWVYPCYAYFVKKTEQVICNVLCCQFVLCTLYIVCCTGTCCLEMKYNYCNFWNKSCTKFSNEYYPTIKFVSVIFGVVTICFSHFKLVDAEWWCSNCIYI